MEELTRKLAVYLKENRIRNREFNDRVKRILKKRAG